MLTCYLLSILAYVVAAYGVIRISLREGENITLGLMVGLTVCGLIPIINALGAALMGWFVFDKSSDIVIFKGKKE